MRRVLGALCMLLTCGGSLDRPDVTEAELTAHIGALRETALARLNAYQARVMNTSYRLRQAGAPLCGDGVAPLLGAAIARRFEMTGTHARKQDVEDALGLGDRVKLIALVEGGPADRAGLRAGDEILEIDGTGARKSSFVLQALRESESGDPVILVARDGTEREVALPRVEGCDPGAFVRIASSANVVPHRGARDLLVSTGMVRFARDEDELAIAIAHQIGHFVQGSVRIPIPEHEVEADRIGLFIAARAGFDVSKAPAFWDRLAADEPWRIDRPVGDGSGRSLPHTAMAMRAPVVRATVQEIEELLRAGEPLRP